MLRLQNRKDVLCQFLPFLRVIDHFAQRIVAANAQRDSVRLRLLLHIDRILLAIQPAVRNERRVVALVVDPNLFCGYTIGLLLHHGMNLLEHADALLVVLAQRQALQQVAVAIAVRKTHFLEMLQNRLSLVKRFATEERLGKFRLVNVLSLTAFSTSLSLYSPQQ